MLAAVVFSPTGVGSARAAVVLLSVIASGCGGATKKPPESATPRVVAEQSQVRGLAHKCRESKAVVVAQIDAALVALGQHGLHGSRAELTEGLEKVVNYAGEREKPDCHGLLDALVATVVEGGK